MDGHRVQMSGSTKLARCGWWQIGLSVVLVATGAFCALQAVISGMFYGDVYGIQSLAQKAHDVQQRGQEYLWACISLQVVNSVILASLFPMKRDESKPLIYSQILTQYLPALVTSVVATGVSLGLLIWVLRTFNSK